MNEESDRLTLRLSQATRDKLDLFLFSDVEQRVPKGAYKNFIEERIREFFGWGKLDLELYGFPHGYFVRGPKEMIDKLKRTLESCMRGDSNATNR